MRERQRADTLRRLHEAAVALMGDDGLSSATVSDIADRAGVSRRTFFNYYACKEDALLGAGPPSVPADELDALLKTRSDRLTKAVKLVLAVAASIRQIDIPPADRKALVHRHPELADRMKQHATEAMEQLAAALAEHFDLDSDDGRRAADRAQATIMLAAAVMRFAYQRDPGVIEDPSSPVVAAAIETFRSTIKDLSNDH